MGCGGAIGTQAEVQALLICSFTGHKGGGQGKDEMHQLPWSLLPNSEPVHGSGFLLHRCIASSAPVTQTLLKENTNAHLSILSCARSTLIMEEANCEDESSLGARSLWSEDFVPFSSSNSVLGPAPAVCVDFRSCRVLKVENWRVGNRVKKIGQCPLLRLKHFSPSPAHVNSVCVTDQ